MWVTRRLVASFRRALPSGAPDTLYVNASLVVKIIRLTSRYSQPFGDGLVLMPRDDGVLTLWAPTDLSGPMHRFERAALPDEPSTADSADVRSDHVKEFAWRPHRVAGSIEPGYQLVSWTKNQNLCFWHITPEIQELVGRRPVHTLAVLPSPLPRPVARAEPSTLQQEFAQSATLPGVRVEEVRVCYALGVTGWLSYHITQANVGARFLVVVVSRGKRQVQLRIGFPVLYPNSAPPSFEFLSRSLPAKQIQRLHEVRAPQWMRVFTG